MKKILLLFISVVFMSTFALSSCKQQAHVHEWKDATCLTPKTCVTCGETEGTALGHKWQDATCLTPKTCVTCGETEGTALGHKWQGATCLTPKTCITCGEVEGSALGHVWNGYTCAVCGTIDVAKKDTAKGNDAVQLLSSVNASCDIMSSIIERAWKFSIYEYKNYYTQSNDATLTGFAKYIGIKKDVAKIGIDSYFGKYGYDTSNYVVYLGVSSIAVGCVEEILTDIIDTMKKNLSNVSVYVSEMTDSNNNGKQEVRNYYVAVKTYAEFCFSPRGSYANLSSTLLSYQNECNKASVSCELYFG